MGGLSISRGKFDMRNLRNTSYPAHVTAPNKKQRLGEDILIPPSNKIE